MGDEEDPGRFEDRPPWFYAGQALLRLWERLKGPDPEWTEADMVAPGAEPICPACVRPHHPLMKRCPNCGEIVSPYATMMAFVWIWVWGPKLQRVMRQERLSRLLWAGLVVSSISFLGVAYEWFWAIPGRRWEMESVVLCLLGAVSASLVPLTASFQMLEAAIRRWGSWRERALGEAGRGPRTRAY